MPRTHLSMAFSLLATFIAFGLHNVAIASQAAVNSIKALDYIKHNEKYNPEAVIPPQCYTRTEGKNNPCYVCHQTYSQTEQRSNLMADGGLQGEYEFSDLGMENSWVNLFTDRTEQIKSLSDEMIQRWVEQDNYQVFIDAKAKDTQWRGEYTPIENLAYPDKAFDEKGLAKDGSAWVAYNYKPFPSTFWPTNGSTGDAMIRLPEAFRQLNGQYNEAVYFANLALVEMAIKDSEQLSTLTIDEKQLGQDLNKDGKHSLVNHIVKQSHYLGDAKNVKIEKMLYPQGTEFLHTVRYLGINSQGEIYNAPRMKEVRYMKKHMFKSVAKLKSAYFTEFKEKEFEQLPKTNHLGDRGIGNGFGWTINAYIEDEAGALRQQHDQEMEFCNGCHKTVGSTIDQTFSFARKLDGLAGWGYIDLKAQKDVPTIGEEQGEFLTYLQRVGGGDEFRQNQEMLDNWFTSDGQVNKQKVLALDNVYQLIMPSKQRALDLNKAYFTLVKEQSYLFGRDAVIGKAKNVLQQVDDSQAPLDEANRYQYDIRLNWQHSALNTANAIKAKAQQGAK
ncbi:hypothetical protein [Marinifaba aquimaris]|uniref:hypothetical protein n=1 Tax=Marinifaba aquimaris TaxID=2741323 RepID=UPI003CCE1494